MKRVFAGGTALLVLWCFELVNDSDRPLNVVVEPRGFSVTDSGELQDAPLPTTLHLKLSAMSFRVPPRQSRFVFYEATADRAPAWFVLYANFTGYPTQDFSGLNVQLELPHLVYILPRERWKPADVRVVSAEIQAETRRLVLVVENTGAHLGRIAELEIRGSAQKVRTQGFPLFPGSRRRLEIAWGGDDRPDVIVVKSGNFSFEQKLQTSPQ